MNPTWLEVAVCANDMLRAKGQVAPAFLEDVGFLAWGRGFNFYEFHIDT